MLSLTQILEGAYENILNDSKKDIQFHLEEKAGVILSALYIGIKKGLINPEIEMFLSSPNSYEHILNILRRIHSKTSTELSIKEEMNVILKDNLHYLILEKIDSVDNNTEEQFNELHDNTEKRFGKLCDDLNSIKETVKESIKETTKKTIKDVKKETDKINDLIGNLSKIMVEIDKKVKVEEEIITKPQQIDEDEGGFF